MSALFQELSKALEKLPEASPEAQAFVNDYKTTVERAEANLRDSQAAEAVVRSQIERRNDQCQ